MSETVRSTFGAFRRVSKDSGFEDIVYIAPSLETIKSRIQGGNPEEESSATESHDDGSNLETELGKGMWAFYDNLRSYYPLSHHIDLIPAVFGGAFFKRNIEFHAKENFERIEEFEGFPIYRLSDVDLAYVNRNLSRWEELDEGFEKLPSSILLSLVATYDSSFSEFAKTLLKSRPERYSGSDKEYKVSDLLKLDSIDQLISMVADDQIDQLMRKSHEDQVKFFEKSFNVSVVDGFDRWAEFVEIFERRNLAAHGALVVNDVYLSNCIAAGLSDLPDKGDSLPITGEYLESAIDLLVEFGCLLALSAWQRQSKSTVQESFESLVEISYSLIKDGHPKVARHLLNYGLSVGENGADEEARKMMVVNMAIALKDCDEIDRAHELLENSDWSASSPKFRVCVSAVKGEVEEACELLHAAHVTDKVGPFEIREWPAFKWVRNDSKFREKCEEIFQEPIWPTSSVTHSEVQSSSGPDG